MNFKVGDIVTASFPYKHESKDLMEGLIKGKINYIYKNKDFFVVDILKHKDRFLEGAEVSLPINNDETFKLYEEPEIPKLKPCPFCGEAQNKGFVHLYNGKYYGKCHECGVHTMDFDFLYDLIEYWNRRV